MMMLCKGKTEPRDTDHLRTGDIVCQPIGADALWFTVVHAEAVDVDGPAVCVDVREIDAFGAQTTGETLRWLDWVRPWCVLVYRT